MDDLISWYVGQEVRKNARRTQTSPKNSITYENLLRLTLADLLQPTAALKFSDTDSGVTRVLSEQRRNDEMICRAFFQSHLY